MKNRILIIYPILLILFSSIALAIPYAGYKGTVLINGTAASRSTPILVYVGGVLQSIYYTGDAETPANYFVIGVDGNEGQQVIFKPYGINASQGTVTLVSGIHNQNLSIVKSITGGPCTHGYDLGCSGSAYCCTNNTCWASCNVTTTTSTTTTSSTTTTTGSSGGGGVGGGTTLLPSTNCTNEWICSEFGQCIGNKKVRTCHLSNRICIIIPEMPAESEACSSPASPITGDVSGSGATGIDTGAGANSSVKGKNASANLSGTPKKVITLSKQFYISVIMVFLIVSVLVFSVFESRYLLGVRK